MPDGSSVERRGRPLPAADLHRYVDHVHRYWQREVGSYPSPDDSAAIVMTIAAMYELHAQRLSA